MDMRVYPVVCLLGVQFISPQIVLAAPPENHGTRGISVVVGSGQTGVRLPVWISPQLALVPFGSLNSTGDGWTEVSVGLGVRFYRRQSGSLFPYIGVKAGTLASIYGWYEDAFFDYTAGLNYGGEYFFARQFSVGIEAQLNVVKSGESGIWSRPPGGITVHTASIIYATLYFK
ncbi:hypothetical protein ES703_87583 [subsurface metagenome]